MRKVFFVFVTFLAIANIVLAQDYSRIGDCDYYLGNSVTDNVTFICGGGISSRASGFFASNCKLYCRNINDGYDKRYVIRIDFKNCDRPPIPENFFDDYYNVYSLNMSSLRTTTGQMGFLTRPNNLTFINASHNEIESLSNGMFGKSNRLSIVDFSFNKINQFESNPFPNENSVEFLDLSHNNICELTITSFHRLNQIKRLLLSHNQITELPSLVFLETKNLVEVDLSFNKIHSIDYFAFSGYLNLHKLNLSHNHLTTLARKTFEIHSNLTHLDVSWNNITIFKPKTFEFQQKLVHLDLSQNAIEKLDKFVGVGKLQYLNLSSNKLCNIEIGTFATLADLQVLDLSGNRLKILHSNILSSPLALKLLYIGHNQITELANFTSLTIPNGKIVGIDTNQINCSHFEQIFNTITLKHFNSFSARINCSSSSEENEPPSSTVQPSSTTEQSPQTTTITIKTVDGHEMQNEPTHSSSTDQTLIQTKDVTMEASKSEERAHNSKDEASKKGIPFLASIQTKANIQSGEKNHTAVTDHKISELEKHLVSMKWFIAIGFGIMIIILATILLLFGFGFGLLKKPNSGNSVSKQVIYHRPDTVTLLKV